MNKQEFLSRLREAMCELPQDEIEERLTFYGEMIDDRIEEGFSEEDAVAAVGAVDDIAAQIITDTPLTNAEKESPISKQPLKPWQVVLIAVGSPIWLVLGIAAVAVILSLYASVWAVIVSLFAVFGACVGCSVGGIAIGVATICNSGIVSATALIGAGLVLAGLSVFAFLAGKAAVKGTIFLTKQAVLLIKNRLIKKGDAI